MSDIAERVLAAIQAEEDTVPPLQLDGRYVGPRTEAERKLLRRCAADREIVEHFRNLVAKYRQMKAVPRESLDEDIELRTIEARIADFAAVILPALARGYGVQPPGRRRDRKGSAVTSEDWDTHYWQARASLKSKGIYEGDEETQREIALRETTEQFGPRP